MSDSGSQPPRSDEANEKAKGSYPTGSLSRLVPGQKASGEIPRPAAPQLSSQGTTAAQGAPADALSNWQSELQAGALAREQNRVASQRGPARSGSTGELDKLVSNRTTQSHAKPSAPAPENDIRKTRSFAVWRSFGISMTALVLLMVCIYATKQASVQTEAKRAYIVGRNLLHDGKYDLAAENFTKSLRRIPYNAEGYFYRGIAEAHTGQFEAALQDFDKVLTFTPERTAAFDGKSLSNLKLREFDKAISAATMALNINPTDKNALLLRSIAHSRKGELKEALADCETLIASKPKSGLGQAYATRAFIYFKMGQILAATRDYRLAIQHTPQNAALYSNLAQCLKRTGDLQGAIAECKACLKLDSKDLPSLLLLGECYRQTGDYKQALHYIERAVTVVASYETLKARADAYIDNGNYELAYNDLDYILRCRPQDEDARRKRQVCHAAVLNNQKSAPKTQSTSKGNKVG